MQKHPHTGDTKEEKDKDDQEWESPRWDDAGDLSMFPKNRIQLNVNICSLFYDSDNSWAMWGPVLCIFPFLIREEGALLSGEK